MSTLYVDSSALGGAYFPDERNHAELSRLIFDSTNDLMTSALTIVELSGAIRSASEAGRVPDPVMVWNSIDADLGPAGPIGVLKLRADPILAIANTIVRQHRVRTLDAIHLAVALEDGTRAAAPDTLVFVTLDQRQSVAARALGIEVYQFAA